jgi:uncharacterized membrane protein HdeD (DUF308 family)
MSMHQAPAPRLTEPVDEHPNERRIVMARKSGRFDDVPARGTDFAFLSGGVSSRWVKGRPWRDSVGGPMATRGILAIAFGILALSGSWISTAALETGFAVYLVLAAAAALVTGLRVNSRPLLFVALADSLIGALLFMPGALGDLELPHLIGAWAMLTGILEMFAAGAFRRSPATKWFHASAGVASILLGVIVGAVPGFDSAATGGWLGALSVFFGVLCLAAAAHTRDRLVGRHDPRPGVA